MIIFYKVTLLRGSISFFYQAIRAFATVDFYIQLAIRAENVADAS